MRVNRRDSIRLTAAALAVAPLSLEALVRQARPATPHLTLEEEVERLADLHEIRNLMSRYEYYHVAGLDEQVIALFASKTPGTRLEINRGWYDGIEGVRKFVMSTAKGEENRIGHLHLHTITTPLIEVAADGKTAQGIFLSPGVETGSRPDGGFNNDWSWLRYGVDFVKEEGEWKFWHLHLYRIFTSPCDKPWTQMPAPTPRTAPEADRSATFSRGYTTTTTMENVPAPPTPYATWDEARAYVK
jgi:hypothetical protein